MPAANSRESNLCKTCAQSISSCTCGLYGRASSPGKGNFVKTMLRPGRERGAVSVVDDQSCTPTSAADLADAIAALITTTKYGLYHATNAGSTTWCGFASEIFRQSGLAVEVKPITTAQFSCGPADPLIRCSTARNLRPRLAVRCALAGASQIICEVAECSRSRSARRVIDVTRLFFRASYSPHALASVRTPSRSPTTLEGFQLFDRIPCVARQNYLAERDDYFFTGIETEAGTNRAPFLQRDLSAKITIR